MGTNYYYFEDSEEIEEIFKDESELDRKHIGKYSGGWPFMFHGYKNLGLITRKAWFDFLEGKRIFTEQGYEITLEEFKRDVLSSCSEENFRFARKQYEKNHDRKDICFLSRFYDKIDWFDIETGHQFCENEFS